MKSITKLFTVASVAALLSLTACKSHDCCCHNNPTIHSNGIQMNGARPSGRNVPRWFSSEVASVNTVEGQLHSQGKTWSKTPSEITVGCYVQDILEGRLDQPKGRGAIGKVTDLMTGSDNIPAAKVDFGNDYSVAIRLSELSRVRITPD